MSAIPYVGKCFATSAEFLDYLDGIKFAAWRPKYVTMHHTGAPDLKTWNGWQTRPRPISDEQWMKNLASYYGNEMGWSSGPHFFFTPKNFCVLSPPDRRGVHAVSFNSNSWGVECVGDFDQEQFYVTIRDKYVEGLATLHVAADLKLLPFKRGVQGLHFHRDDPKTSKTCPGKKVFKPELIKLVQAKIDQLSGGSHEDEKVVPVKRITWRKGIINTDNLNVRASASGKAPIVSSLNAGAAVVITGEAKNGDTGWLSIDIPGDGDGWVAARFVNVG